MILVSISVLTGCGGNGSETAEKENVSVKEEATAEETESEEKEEIDTSIYSEKVELTTLEGENVWIYYDPTVVTNWSGENDWGGYDVCLGDMMDIFVEDAESAQAVADRITEGYLKIRKHEEIQLSGYTIHYFSFEDPESGNFVTDARLIELGSNVVCGFYAISTEEGSQLEKELEAIKFAVGDVAVENENKTESSQNNNKEDNTENNAERDLQACGILDMKIDAVGNVTHEETGILTYDAGKVEYVSTDEYGVEFDVRIKQNKKTNILPVKLSIVNYVDMEDFYQEWKSATLEFDANAEVSEMKETVINEIAVGYFTRVYHSKDGEHENRDLYCFVDFPTIDNREKGIEIWMPYKLEEELHLNSLKDLLIDIEIQGVKPNAAGEESKIVEKIEIDHNIFSAEEHVETSKGKTVKIYYNPDVISRLDTMTEGMFLPYDMNNDRCLFIAGDGVVENIGEGVKEAYSDAAEYTEVAEAFLGEYKVYSFQMIHEDGYTITYAYIDLGSEVLLQIDEMHNDFDESTLEVVVNAMRFEVE